MRQLCFGTTARLQKEGGEVSSTSRLALSLSNLAFLESDSLLREIAISVHLILSRAVGVRNNYFSNILPFYEENPIRAYQDVHRNGTETNNFSENKSWVSEIVRTDEIFPEDLL